MKVSDLIGLDVVDRSGRALGRVLELRCVLDGPPRGSLATPRIDALITTRRHTGFLLGYDRPQQRGPWLVRAISTRLHRHRKIIPWSAVAGYEGRITLRVDAANLPADV
jgi:hypothetical protein